MEILVLAAPAVFAMMETLMPSLAVVSAVMQSRLICIVTLSESNWNCTKFFVNFSNESQLVLPGFVVLQLHSADFVPQTPTQHMLSPFQLTKVNFAPVNLELVS